MTTQSEVKGLVRRAVAQGWTVEKKGGKHFHLVSPQGKRVPFSYKLGSSKAFVSFRSRLKKAGL